jgi:hypothetical protein
MTAEATYFLAFHEPPCELRLVKCEVIVQLARVDAFLRNIIMFGTYSEQLR